MTNRGTGRPAVLQQRILDDLRRQIVSGKWQPGSRLPTRRDLCQAFDVSTQTVQLALDSLTREGFVDARGTLGTFVVSRPPHLASYAVIFSGLPGAPNAPRFWQALSNEVNRLEQVDRMQIRCVMNIDGHRDSEDFQLLSREVSQHRLAGLVFVGPPWEMQDTAILDEPGIPRVMISVPSDSNPNLACVQLDNQSLFIKALDQFVAMGRKRLGIVCHPGMSPDRRNLLDWDKFVFPAIAARGITLKPYWIQCASQTYPETARRVVHMMFAANPKDRPDALFITDDKFVEQAIAGIYAAGVRVPEELEIIAHCNFPWPVPTSMPMRRLGFDSRHVLRCALDLLAAQRRGKKKPGITSIVARFEDELKN